jgi:hypothetical protein
VSNLKREIIAQGKKSEREMLCIYKNQTKMEFKTFKLPFSVSLRFCGNKKSHTVVWPLKNQLFTKTLFSQ